MPTPTSDKQQFFEADLVLQVSPHVDPTQWDEDRYDGFLAALCGERPYQREAITTALRYLLGGESADLAELAAQNFAKNPLLAQRYGSLDRMKAKLTFPDKLAGTIDLATGTGKSYVMYGIAAILLAEGVVDRVLVLCPSTTIENGLMLKFKELASKATLKMYLPSDAKIETPSIINGQDTIKVGDICVENYHQILEGARSSIRDSLKEQGARTLVLNDETHHATNGTGADERKWTQFLSDADYGFRYVLGVTGTAYQNNDYFPDVIFRYSLKSALEEKFVKKIDYVVEDAKVRDQSEKWQLIHKRHKEERERLKSRNILPLTIIVADKTAKADEVAADLREFLREAEGWSEEEALKNVLCVHSKNPEVARLAMVDKPYSTVEWIVSVAMLTEGWDVKRVFGIVPHEERAFNSKLLVAQVLGRALRIPDGWSGGEVPKATVWNHESWARKIKHLVDSILEQENKIAIRVRPDSPFNFDLHQLEYDMTQRLEVKAATTNPLAELQKGWIDLSSDVAREKVSVTTEMAGTGQRMRWQTEIVRTTFTPEQIAQTMFDRLAEFSTLEHVYTEEWPLERVLKLVNESLNKVGITEPTDRIKQRFLKALGSLRRKAASVPRMDSALGKFVTISTKTRRVENVSASALRAGGNRVLFWTDGSRDTLEIDEAAFFDAAIESGGEYREFEVRNKHFFRTPMGLVLSESKPEFDFIRGLVDKDNAPHLAAWLKSVNTGFYTVPFNWSKNGVPKRGNFNPDFFLKVSDNLICVVEIKDQKQETDPSDENKEKAAFATEHFARINEHLVKEGKDLLYCFNFLTPEDYGTFFDYLRTGKLEKLQTGLDVALKG